jgi:hypothetical protein
MKGSGRNVSHGNRNYTDDNYYRNPHNHVLGSIFARPGNRFLDISCCR